MVKKILFIAIISSFFVFFVNGALAADVDNLPFPQTQPYPQPQVNLSGIWGAMSNGQQVVVHIQGNQYQTWVNGTLFEAGAFQIQGNTMHVQTITGTEYSQYIQLSADGMSLSFIQLNGSMSIFQRMQ